MGWTEDYDRAVAALPTLREKILFSQMMLDSMVYPSNNPRGSTPTPLQVTAAQISHAMQLGDRRTWSASPSALRAALASLRSQIIYQFNRG